MMKKIKWENIVFMILAIMYIVHSFKIENNAIYTLIVQLIFAYLLRVNIKFVRINWNLVKKEVKEFILD